EAGQSVYVDPANLPVMEEWIRKSDDPSVAGGRYVLLDGALKSPWVNAEISIPKTDKYFLLARVGIGNSLDERNFDVSLGGKYKELNFNPKYHWTRPGKTFKVVFLDALGELEEGKYQLQFGSKEAIELNELILTNNPAV